MTLAACAVLAVLFVAAAKARGARADAAHQPPSDDVADVYARILRHESETPMRGHDPDGTCCRRARLGLNP